MDDPPRKQNRTLVPLIHSEQITLENGHVYDVDVHHDMRGRHLSGYVAVLGGHGCGLQLHAFRGRTPEAALQAAIDQINQWERES